MLHPRGSSADHMKQVVTGISLGNHHVTRANSDADGVTPMRLCGERGLCIETGSQNGRRRV